MAGSSTETIPTSSDGSYDVGNIKVEEDVDMPKFEEVYVRTENVVFSMEEDCIDIKDEEGKYTEEEEDIDKKEEKDVAVQEEVS
jgi:hypothetical protein